MIAYDKNLNLINFNGLLGYEIYLRSYCNSNDIRNIYYKINSSDRHSEFLFDDNYYIKSIISSYKGGD